MAPRRKAKLPTVEKLMGMSDANYNKVMRICAGAIVAGKVPHFALFYRAIHLDDSDRAKVWLELSRRLLDFIEQMGIREVYPELDKYRKNCETYMKKTGGVPDMEDEEVVDDYDEPIGDEDHSTNELIGMYERAVERNGSD